MQPFPVVRQRRRDDVVAREFNPVVQVAQPDDQVVLQRPQPVEFLRLRRLRLRLLDLVVVGTLGAVRVVSQGGRGVLGVVSDERFERFEIVWRRHRAERLVAEEHHAITDTLVVGLPPLDIVRVRVQVRIDDAHGPRHLVRPMAAQHEADAHRALG